MKRNCNEDDCWVYQKWLNSDPGDAYGAPCFGCDGNQWKKEKIEKCNQDEYGENRNPYSSKEKNGNANRDDWQG
jgi:hypothetical protein